MNLSNSIIQSLFKKLFDDEIKIEKELKITHSIFDLIL
jgi:hypothetical protein